jgi:hypothetical protein
MTDALKRPNRCMTQEMGVTLKEHLEKLIDLRFAAMDREINEARRIMETRMKGFPSEFAQKGDMVTTASTLKELKDKDLEELKVKIEARLGRDEYEQKHAGLMEKIEIVKEEVNGIKNERANIQGRIVGTGATIGVIVSIVIVVSQIVIHVYMGK